MKIEKFKQALRAARPEVTIEEPHVRNTNNAWGFGGMIGHSLPFTLGEERFEYRVGRAYFRHLPSEPVAYVVSLEPGSHRQCPHAFLKSL